MAKNKKLDRGKMHFSPRKKINKKCILKVISVNVFPLCKWKTGSHSEAGVKKGKCIHSIDVDNYFSTMYLYLFMPLL